MTSPGIFGFVKRVLPFAAALMVGVFITSLFVDLKRPQFGRGWKAKKHQELQRLRRENEELKNENLRLRNEVEGQRWDELKMKHPGHEEWRNELSSWN
ncbi:MAG: hypothetical protein IPG58_09810 [Acidobacteria bacterium]|nr:hypothetical protein [Acidobacteriota bacterium]